MCKNLLALLALISLGVSCKFTDSPYSANTPKLLLNSVNLSRIKEQEASAGANFKIALLSDTHNFYNELDKAIRKINKSGPYAFVIITGDITNLGLLEEYHMARRYFNRLKYPYLVVVGNHDLVANGQVIFENMFGLKNFAFTYKDVNFVAFNNNNWEHGGNVPNRSWVESEISSASTTFNVLLAHISPTDSDRFSAEEIQAWEELMDTYNVDYFFNGHNHNPAVGRIGASTVHVTIGAPAKRRYSELIYTAGGGGHLEHKKVSF